MYFAIMGDFCAAGSQLRVRDNRSTAAAWHTRRRHTPHQERPSFRGLLLLVRSCSCPHVQVQNVQLGVVFCLDQFRLLQHLKVEL